MSRRFVEVELTILGRAKMPVLTGGIYRPHLRVEGCEYLGVSFVDGPYASPGSTVRAVAALIYDPEVDYCALLVGTHFDVLEGPKVVGSGRVVRGPFTPSMTTSVHKRTSGHRMRSISVQVQPDRSPSLDIKELSALFQEVADDHALVTCHSFDSGDEDGLYFNFTFQTDDAVALWNDIRRLVFETPRFQQHLSRAAMAMCSSDNGWDSYVQLRHWDTQVPLVADNNF